MEADVLVEVGLFNPHEGGRSGPTPDESFGCIFVFGSKCFDGRLLLGGFGALRPGQTARVPVKFLCPADVAPHLHVGASFDLRDFRVFGRGVVLETYFDKSL